MNRRDLLRQNALVDEIFDFRVANGNVSDAFQEESCDSIEPFQLDPSAWTLFLAELTFEWRHSIPLPQLTVIVIIVVHGEHLRKHHQIIINGVFDFCGSHRIRCLELVRDDTVLKGLMHTTLVEVTEH